MKYRITIEEVTDSKNNSTYPSHNEVYQQIVEGLKVHKLVAAINSKPDDDSQADLTDSLKD